MDNNCGSGLTVAGMTVQISPPRKPSATKPPAKRKPLLSEKAKDKLYKALMNDPTSKKMVLNLIKENKDKIEEYKRTELGQSSPVNKVKKPIMYESPTALIRRRALEKQKRQQLDSNKEPTTSTESCTSSCSTPKKPKKILLKGVHAFVQVFGAGGIDKSEAFKNILTSMGATICPTINKQCTHVIYKDGTYETYNRAKKLKKFVVSILWLDAINRSGVRVSEKDYPALGDCDAKFASDNFCDKICNNRTSLSGSTINNSQTRKEMNRRNTTCALQLDNALPDYNDDDDDVFINEPNETLSTPNLVTTRRRTQRKNSPNFFQLLTSDDDDNDSDAASDSPLISGSANHKSLYEIACSIKLNNSLSEELQEVPNKTSSKIMTPKVTEKNKENFSITPISPRKSRKSVLTENSKSSRRKTFVSFDSPPANKSSTEDSQNRTSSIITPNRQRKRRTLLPMDVLNGVTDNTKLSVVDMEISQETESSGSDMKKDCIRKTIHFNDSMELTLDKEAEPDKTDQSIKIISNLILKSSDKNLKRKDSNSSKNSAISNNSNLEVLGFQNLDKINKTKRSSMSSTHTSTSEDLSIYNQTRITRRMSKQLSQNNSRLDFSNESPLKLHLSTSNELSSKQVIDTNSKISAGTDLSLRISEKSNEFDMSPLQLSSNSSSNKITPDRNKSKRNSDASLLSSIASDTCLSLSSDQNRKKCKNSLLTSDESSSDFQKSTNSKFETKGNMMDSCSSEDSLFSKVRKSHISETEPVTGRKSDSPISELSKQMKTTCIKSNKLKYGSLLNGKTYSSSTLSSQQLSHEVDSSSMTTSSSSNLESEIVNNSETTSFTDSSEDILENENKSGSDKATSEISKVTSKNDKVTSEKDKTIFKSPDKSPLTDELILQTMANDSNCSANDKGKQLHNKTTPEFSKKPIELLDSIIFRKPIINDNIKSDKKSQTPSKRSKPSTSLNDETLINSGKSSDVLLSSTNIIEDSINCTAINSTNLTSCPSTIFPRQSPINGTLLNSQTLNGTKSTTSSSRNKRKLCTPDDIIENVAENHEQERLEHSQSQRIKTASENKKKLQDRLNALKIDETKQLINEASQQTQNKKIKDLSPVNKIPEEILQDEDFIPFSQITQKPVIFTQSQKNTKRKFIVCSRFNREQVIIFRNIVKKLGEFTIEKKVSARTTHLVAAEPVKTLNTLNALARGIWILKQNWLFDSMEAEKWLQEDSYEMIEFSPLLQQLRLQREAFKKSFTHDVFVKCEPIYISDNSHPPKDELIELVTICKGTVVTEMTEAKILIGVDPADCCDDTKFMLKESWILDSVYFGHCKKFKPYLII